MAINLFDFTVPIPAPVIDVGSALPNAGNSTNFGSNVYVFQPSQNSSMMQQVLDQVYNSSTTFDSMHSAVLFKPGTYNLTFQVGFQTTVQGLGYLPDDTTINGGVNTFAPGSALGTFWRGIENLAVKPTTHNNTSFFATSQACWLRRMHYYGNLDLYDSTVAAGSIGGGSYSADILVDGTTNSGPGSAASTGQVYYFSRNSKWANWIGYWFNMVFVGASSPPQGSYPQQPYTVVPAAPVIREKPYLAYNDSAGYSVVVPSLRRNATGTSWSLSEPGLSVSIPISRFYIAQTSNDNSTTINLALQRGMHLIITPGVYNLASPIVIRSANTVVLGMGLPSLVPMGAFPAVFVTDVGGVSLAGLLFDAGTSNSPSLLQWGSLGNNTDHSINPSFMFDCHHRVGGVTATAMTQACAIVNSDNVILDNSWIWRADHGASKNVTGWNINPATTGLQVNGKDFTAYGLFVEHFKGYQTIFNGENAQVYFYQSEIPYDIPSQASWRSPGGQNGYPSYVVAANVVHHLLIGGTVANILIQTAARCYEGFSTPNTSNIAVSHLGSVYGLSSNQSGIDSIVNGYGPAIPGNLTLTPGLTAVFYAGGQANSTK